MKTIEVTSCFVCVYRSNTFFRFLFPIKGCCPHSKSLYSETPQFSVFKPFIVVILALSLIALILSVPTLFSTDKVCRSDKSLCLLGLGEEIFVWTTAILAISMSCKVGSKLQELSTWSMIFTSCDSFGLSTIVDQKHYKRLVNKRIVLSTVALIFLSVGNLIRHFLFSDSLPLALLRRFLLYCSTLFQTFMLLENYIKLEIGGLILKSVKESLLRNRESGTKLDNFRRLSTLVMVFQHTLCLWMQYMTFLLSTWMLTTTIMIIFNIYVFVEYDNTGHLSAVGVLGFRTLVTICLIAKMLSMHDSEFKDRVSDYLISILNFIRIN